MADKSERNRNFNPTLQGVSSVDGASPTNVQVDPTDNHTLVKKAAGVSDSPTDFEGAPISVGTTAVEMTFSGTTQVISIQSDHDNSGKIWIGKSNVTNAGGNAFGRLAAGQAVEISLNDSSNAVYVISDTASQTVLKMALV